MCLRRPFILVVRTIHITPRRAPTAVKSMVWSAWSRSAFQSGLGSSFGVGPVPSTQREWWFRDVSGCFRAFQGRLMAIQGTQCACTELYGSSLCDAGRRREQDAKIVGPDVGPTSALYSNCCSPTGAHGPTRGFWANVTPCSLRCRC